MYHHRIGWNITTNLASKTQMMPDLGHSILSFPGLIKWSNINVSGAYLHVKITLCLHYFHYCMQKQKISIAKRAQHSTPVYSMTSNHVWDMVQGGWASSYLLDMFYWKLNISWCPMVIMAAFLFKEQWTFSEGHEFLMNLDLVVKWIPQQAIDKVSALDYCVRNC